MGPALMPSEAASAVPIPCFAGMLALLAFGSFVKVLQLESPITAEFACFAGRTGEAEHIALLLLGICRLRILHKNTIGLLLYGIYFRIPSRTSLEIFNLIH